uniref:Lipoprotein n=1 Tax=Panagrolaimus sp. JU765 TaxID=591449 RepID=A0AC34QLF5_9BILA
MMKSLIFLPILFFILTSACEDGFDNVIPVIDLLQDKEASIHFKDIKLHSYDEFGKPLCKSAIKFPGFLKVAEGEIEVKHGLNPNDDIRIEFDLKQNSIMVGTVCKNGKSKNTFVPDEVCNFEVCKAAPGVCQALSTSIVLSLDDLPDDYKGMIPVGPFGLSAVADYKGMIPVGPFGLSAVAGDWKATARITKKGKTIAAIQIGESGKWTGIEMGDEKSNKVYEKTKAKFEDQKKAGIKEEL